MDPGVGMGGEDKRKPSPRGGGLKKEFSIHSVWPELL